jgi:hypothetical protein
VRWNSKSQWRRWRMPRITMVRDNWNVAADAMLCTWLYCRLTEFRSPNVISTSVNSPNRAVNNNGNMCWLSASWLSVKYRLRNARLPCINVLTEFAIGRSSVLQLVYIYTSNGHRARYLLKSVTDNGKHQRMFWNNGHIWWKVPVYYWYGEKELFKVSVR